MILHLILHLTSGAFCLAGDGLGNSEGLAAADYLRSKGHASRATISGDVPCCFAYPQGERSSHVSVLADGLRLCKRQIRDTPKSSLSAEMENSRRLQNEKNKIHLHPADRGADAWRPDDRDGK